MHEGGYGGGRHTAGRHGEAADDTAERGRARAHPHRGGGGSTLDAGRGLKGNRTTATTQRNDPTGQRRGAAPP